MALKKKFIEIEIPIIEESTSVLGTAETLDKKTIKLDLSRKLKGKGLEITFKIFNKDKKLIAYPKNLLLMRSYIQRIMRKRVNYVEDSFLISCKDISANIKPFLITRKKVSRAIRNNLRKTAREFVIEYAKQKTFLELAKSTIYGDLQREMHPKLKKVYPLSLCEIRVLETSQLEKANLEMPKEIPQVETKVEETTKVEQIEEVKEDKKEEKPVEKEEEKKEKSSKKSKTKKEE